MNLALPLLEEEMPKLTQRIMDLTGGNRTAVDALIRYLQLGKCTALVNISGEDKAMIVCPIRSKGCEPDPKRAEAEDEDVPQLPVEIFEDVKQRVLELRCMDCSDKLSQELLDEFLWRLRKGRCVVIRSNGDQTFAMENAKPKTL